MQQNIQEDISDHTISFFMNVEENKQNIFKLTPPIESRNLLISPSNLE